MDIQYWPKPEIFIIGLLGGVASGKSMVAKVFSELGAHTIDADQLVHRALSDPNVQYEIVQLWGNNLVVAGEVDKKALAQIVFPKEGPEKNRELKKLENIIHPIVIRAIQQRLEKLALAGKKLVVLDVALLWESGLYRLCDLLIFIDTPMPLRQKRAGDNRNWPPEEVAIRERFQSSLAEKKAAAHVIVANGGDLQQTRQQIEQIWQTCSAS